MMLLAGNKIMMGSRKELSSPRGVFLPLLMWVVEGKPNFFHGVLLFVVVAEKLELHDDQALNPGFDMPV